MLTFITGVIVGTVVGWAVPQPEWAKRLQTKVVNWFKSR